MEEQQGEMEPVAEVKKMGSCMAGIGKGKEISKGAEESTGRQGDGQLCRFCLSSCFYREAKLRTVFTKKLKIL